ncbi:hypothetical protein IWQ60_005162 [Tieghemiomyces parasiticus]|uniref:Uncharacterized protein n=1 Tax=Tieghemiomyces parasiticus TaxID=78921 RepID=A0A9W8DYH1_9FUNG|nr:hypothetical protein IWQ60_005162 [Tieghemiomyces parasiticus]
MIFRSALPPVDIPNVDIVTFLRAKIRTCPYWTDRDRAVFIDAATEESLSIAQFEAELTRLTAGWQHTAGLAIGDVVALVAPNDIRFSVGLFSILAAGGTVTLVNPAYTAAEMAQQLADAGARFALVAPEAMATVAETRIIKPESTYLLHPTIRPPGSRNLADLASDQPPRTSISPLPTSPAYLCYSSGTTGRPKAVALTHRNIVANVCQVDAFKRHHGLSHSGQTLAGILPFFHTYGLTILLHLGLVQGFTVVAVRRFQLDDFVPLVAQFRINAAYLVPPVIISLFKDPRTRAGDLSSLVEVGTGAAPFSAQLIHDILTVYAVRFGQGYGLTEASPAVLFTPAAAHSSSAVGVLLPNMEAKIVAEDGRALGYGETGELCLRGPNVMSGYLNNPEATTASFDADGFLLTGDLGHVSVHDEFFITDRIKELIKYKGFQVAPAELEAVLISHPAVREAVVLGSYDPEQLTELPRALVVRQPDYCNWDAEELAREIAAFTNDQVAGYKKLRGGVSFIDSLPKSAAGKVMRRQLRTQLRLGNPLGPT